MKNYVLGAFLSLLSLSTAFAQQNQATQRSDGAVTSFRTYGVQTGCPQTLIFSHGLGGDEAAAEGFALFMAKNGWRVLVMRHEESGRPALRAALFSADRQRRTSSAVADPQLHAARMLDLDAILRVSTSPCRPRQLVLAGHSMGAATTILEAGANSVIGRLGRNRFDAYIAFSPQGIGFLFEKGAWQNVSRPVLMITGTRDRGVDGEFSTRLSAFDGLPPGRKRLAIVKDATHIQLSAKGHDIGSLLGQISLDFLQQKPAVSKGDIEFRDK